MRVVVVLHVSCCTCLAFGCSTNPLFGCSIFIRMDCCHDALALAESILCSSVMDTCRVGLLVVSGLRGGGSSSITKGFPSAFDGSFGFLYKYMQYVLVVSAWTALRWVLLLCKEWRGAAGFGLLPFQKRRANKFYHQSSPEVPSSSLNLFSNISNREAAFFSFVTAYGWREKGEKAISFRSSLRVVSNGAICVSTSCGRRYSEFVLDLEWWDGRDLVLCSWGLPIDCDFGACHVWALLGAGGVITKDGEEEAERTYSCRTESFSSMASTPLWASSPSVTKPRISSPDSKTLLPEAVDSRCSMVLL